MKPESTQNSTDVSYRVEARDAAFNHTNPVILSDGILGPNWREVFRGYDMTFELATAHAWLLVAEHEHRSVECRLVRYMESRTVSVTRCGILDQPVITGALRRAGVPLVNEGTP